MQKVFISNSIIQETESIVINDFFAADNLPIKEACENGNIIFVIDVHYTYESTKKMQEHGGVIVYRHLLNQFKDCQDRLKVVFYSPIPVEQLVSLRPESYVLKLLPFIELFPIDAAGNYIEDWNFKDVLNSKIEEGKYDQFNNASENLLSGWAIAGAKKIDIKSKRLLVIDDEWQQWKAVYDEILAGFVDYFLKDETDIKAEFKKLNNNTFSHLPEGSLAQYDFIISDLYLWENHETDKWKTEEFINSISGFLLFKLIRNIEPAIPVIFHTTSTKFRIFEALSALGADGQIPKNISYKAHYKDKKDTFKLFEKVIINCVEDYGGCWLSEFYRYISDNNALTYELWRRKDDTKKQEAIELIKHAILGYKNLKVHNKEYFDLFFSDKEVNPVSIPASGILNVLGKVKEVLKGRDNPEIQFCFYMRNHASHEKNYHLFCLDDVKIALVLLFETIKANPQRAIAIGQEFNIPLGSPNNRHRYSHQIFHYVHYFNYWNGFIPNELQSVFEERLSYFIDKYHSEHWINFNQDEKNTVKNQFRSIQIVPSISSDYQKQVINGQVVIKFKN